uniref:Uncharacterized protein n=1 Tax=Myotis myotis TaxID=51298 RepID=A0A7J7R7H1_MYOMY|nr:hypothetical protein mMyoMyo1_010883 [Myotis myotis]
MIDCITLKLHEEIMAISNSESPLLPPSEVAKQIFDTLEGWFSHFHSLSMLWSAAMTISVILIILYFLPVGIRILGASLRAIQTSIHELRLKNKEGGDVGTVMLLAKSKLTRGHGKALDSTLC